MDCAQTPLLELLRGVPLDARVMYEHTPTSHQNIPAGRLCADAAAEIERLRDALDTMHEALDAIGETGTGYWMAERMQEVAVAALRSARLQKPADSALYPGGWLNSGPPDAPDCDPRC
jgi:hypothetical protein